MPSRVLVVDDNAGICGLIHEVLLSVEIESLALTSSAEAVPHLAREKFAAVFLDVRMPPPDGIELTRKIRESGLNLTTPIIVVTGEDDRALMSRAFQAGASFFLFKPIDRHDILRLVRVTQGSIENERRRYRRVKVRCKVAIESGPVRSTGSSLDLSIGGMCVQASPLFSVGTHAKVVIEMKPGQSVSLAARVLRVFGEDCMGMQFENVGMQQSKALQDYLLPLIPAISE